MKNKFIVGLLCIAFSALHMCYGLENGSGSGEPQLSSYQRLSNRVRVPTLYGRGRAATTALSGGALIIIGALTPSASQIPWFVGGGLVLLMSGCMVINDRYYASQMQDVLCEQA